MAADCLRPTTPDRRCADAPNQLSSTFTFTPFHAMENVNVAELVERLGSDEDAVRKMAVFKLQSNIGDPSFADLFIAEGGLTRLRYLTLHASGNTLAYSLTSFARLLDVDKGWECVDEELVERVSCYTLQSATYKTQVESC